MNKVEEFGKDMLESGKHIVEYRKGKWRAALIMKLSTLDLDGGGADGGKD